MPPQTLAAPAAAPAPAPHEHDSVAVTNIDVDCSETTSYTVERSIPVASLPGETNPMNIPRHQSQLQEGEFSHEQYFEVRYNSQPFRIAPGETKVFPRYIAEHFAKHLADHVLQKMEAADEIEAKKTGRSPRRGLVQSNVERPKVLNRILETKVWFLDGQQPQVNILPGANEYTDGPATDLGLVPNYAVGNLKAEPKTAEQILAESGEDFVSPGPIVEAPSVGAQVSTPAVVDLTPPEAPTTQPSLPTEPVERSKPDLIREAVMLGIEVTGRESAEDLKQKITAFAGL